MAIASFVSRAHSRERVQINSQGRHWFDFRRSCVGRATGEMKEPDCGPVPQRARPEDPPRPSVADLAGAPSMSKAGMPCPTGRTFCHGRSRMATRLSRGERGEGRSVAPIHEGTIPEGLRPKATTTGKRQIRRSAKGVGGHRLPTRPMGLQSRVQRPAPVSLPSAFLPLSVRPAGSSGQRGRAQPISAEGSESRATCSSALRQALQLRPSRRMKSRTLP